MSILFVMVISFFIAVGFACLAQAFEWMSRKMPAPSESRRWFNRDTAMTLSMGAAGLALLALMGIPFGLLAAMVWGLIVPFM
jgi:hypothetical protein